LGTKPPVAASRSTTGCRLSHNSNTFGIVDHRPTIAMVVGDCSAQGCDHVSRSHPASQGQHARGGCAYLITQA